MGHSRYPLGKIKKMENPTIQYKSIYLIGAVSTLILIGMILTDMIVGTLLTGGDISTLPQTAVERYNEFQDNWVLGLYHLDFWNMLFQIVTIPSIFAVYMAHKNKDIGYALLAFILFLIGSTVFIAGNTALPMFELSKKFFSANTDLQSELIAAAGEAMLAKGAHGSKGMFLGFAIPTFSSILISHVMLMGRIFSKSTAYIGIVGNSLMLIYLFLIAFVPETDKIAVVLAMPGGLLALTWYVLYMIKLFQLSK
jgi:hypothetical protein